MAFYGNPRAHGAGRKPGTPNKDTRTLEEICVQYEISPFEAMIELALETRDPYLKFNCLKELAKYIYPQRKAVEHAAKIDNPYAGKSLPELRALVEERLKQ